MFADIVFEKRKRNKIQGRTNVATPWGPLSHTSPYPSSSYQPTNQPTCNISFFRILPTLPLPLLNIRTNQPQYWASLPLNTCLEG